MLAFEINQTKFSMYMSCQNRINLFPRFVSDGFEFEVPCHELQVQTCTLTGREPRSIKNRDISTANTPIHSRNGLILFVGFFMNIFFKVIEENAYLRYKNTLQHGTHIIIITMK